MLSTFRLITSENHFEFDARLPNDFISRAIRIGVILLVCWLLSRIENVNSNLKMLILIQIPIMGLWAETYRFRAIRCGEELNIVASRFLFGSKRITLPLATIRSVQPTPWLGPSPWISIENANRFNRLRLMNPYWPNPTEIQQKASSWIMSQTLMGKDTTET